MNMIIIEQDAMLRVLNTASSLLPCHPRDAVPWISPSVGGLVEANAALSKTSSLDTNKRSESDFCPDLLSLESDEDCISLSSCSTAASSSCTGSGGERRVSFAAPLVTDVKTRPRTKDCDKRSLFYTSQETDRWVDYSEWCWWDSPAINWRRCWGLHCHFLINLLDICAEDHVTCTYYALRRNSWLKKSQKNSEKKSLTLTSKFVLTGSVNCIEKKGALYPPTMYLM